MFGITKKEINSLSDELFNKWNLDEILIKLNFRWYNAWQCWALVKYSSWSLTWEKKVVWENIKEILEKIEEFVNSIK